MSHVMDVLCTLYSRGQNGCDRCMHDTDAMPHVVTTHKSMRHCLPSARWLHNYSLII